MVTAWSQRDRVVIPVARGRNRANAPSAIVYFRDPQIKREVTGWIKRLLLSLKARNVSVRDLFPGEKLEEVSQLTKLGFHLKTAGRINRFRIVNIRNRPVIQATKGNTYYYVALTEDEIKRGLEEIQGQEGASGTNNQQQGSGSGEAMDTAQDGNEERSLARTDEVLGPASEDDVIQQAARDTAMRMKTNVAGPSTTGGQAAASSGAFPPLPQRNSAQYVEARNGPRSRLNHNNSSQDSRMNTYAEQARRGGQRPPCFGGEFVVQQRLQQMSNENLEADGGQMYDDYGFFDPSRYVPA